MFHGTHEPPVETLEKARLVPTQIDIPAVTGKPMTSRTGKPQGTRQTTEPGTTDDKKQTAKLPTPAPTKSAPTKPAPTRRRTVQGGYTGYDLRDGL
jgi:hypothetical protein